MLLKPLIFLGIDRVGINAKYLRDVSIYNSIDMTLPELTFKIEDPSGEYLSKFNLYIGAIVNTAVFDSDRALEGDNVTGANYMDFVVTKIFDGFEHQTERLGGFVQVWCKPAWYMFGTYQGHAYSPMKLSELIKKVCQDANSNIKLDVKDENFAASSDPGNTPRYKCNESDIDFIEKKLIPYTNIDDSNVFFYLDWFNCPHLSSFSRLINQTETVIFYPSMSLAGSVHDKISSIIESKNLSNAYAVDSMTLTIGNDDIKKSFAVLKKQIVLENNETGKVYIANQQPVVKLGVDSGDNYFAKMPINAISMETINATSSDLYPNRLLPDALALARNGDNDIIDFMQVEIEISRIIEGFIVGETCYLLTPISRIDTNDKSISDEDKKKVVHWMNGKWLIKSIQITQQNARADESKTIITLARPTIQFNVKSTTIEKPSYFYTVA